MGTASNIFVSIATVYVGTAGSEPLTNIGFCDGDSVSTTFDESFLDANVSEKILFVKRAANAPSASMKCTAMEATLANMAIGLPAASLSGSTITRTSTNTNVTPCSVKIVGVTESGAVRTYKALYAYAKLGEVKFGPKDWLKLPLEFEAFGGGDVLWTITDGSTASNVTLSSGTFTRVAGLNYYVVSGEGAAADTLDDISGTLTASEIFFLKIASADQPITLNDDDDVLELDPRSDWIMTSIDDWIAVQNLSGVLTEVQRYKA